MYQAAKAVNERASMRLNVRRVEDFIWGLFCPACFVCVAEVKQLQRALK